MNIELELYKKMYLIRACENAIIREYNNDGMKTPMHMSMGSEHISSAVCLSLGDRAQVSSSYRSHAPFLARTEDTDQFFLEMYGRKESVLGGRGGSMHLCYPEKGFIMSSAIVASQISVACGYAWANKQKKNDKIVVVFFGDGAVQEGAFWESVNIAFLYDLPIIFVCEDNGLAVHSKLNTVLCYMDLHRSNYGWFGVCDYSSIYYKVCKNKTTPLFLHCSYHRMLEHVGINEDYDEGYRVKPDITTVDPVLMLEKQLIKDIVDAGVVSGIEYNINKKVNKSLEKVKSTV